MTDIKSGLCLSQIGALKCRQTQIQIRTQTQIQKVRKLAYESQNIKN